LCSDPKDIQQYQEVTGAEETVFFTFGCRFDPRRWTYE